MRFARTIIAVSMAFALLAGCGGAGGKGKKEERLVQSVAVFTVKLDTVVRTVQLLGTLQGDKQAMAMPKIAGRVTEIVRPEGSSVGEGDPIAYVVNDVPGMDFKPGPVTAPVSGTVGKVYVEVGQSVAPGMPVASVASYGTRVRVKVNVSDQDLRFVRPGARGVVTVAAFPDETFAGTVSRVTPMLDQTSRTATAELVVENRGRQLVPGMACAVRLVLERRETAVAIPLTALFNDGSARVAVLDGAVARFRPVELGLVGDRSVEVVSGIQPGEKVITTGKERVKDGDQVKPAESGQQ
jgi:multidrug efflux pump subunit AcrA (membrane-fusion protein)